MSKLLSNCCKTPMETIHSEGGTSFYLCSKCQKPCDPLTECKIFFKWCVTHQTYKHKKNKVFIDNAPVEGVSQKKRSTGECRYCFKENGEWSGLWDECINPWEEEFDKRFTVAIDDYTKTRVVSKDIKDFIRTLLAQTKQQQRKEIEKEFITSMDKDGKFHFTISNIKWLELKET